jgi:hypothetical protein
MGFCSNVNVLAAKVFGTKFGGPGLTLTMGMKTDEWPHQHNIGTHTKYIDFKIKTL